MEEMVEPDRTILMVSIIGLVVIWGSVAYHRFLQDGRDAVAALVPEAHVADGGASAPVPAGGAAADAARGGHGRGKRGRRR